jgi:hypothetical protein
MLSRKLSNFATLNQPLIIISSWHPSLTIYWWRRSLSRFCLTNCNLEIMIKNTSLDHYWCNLGENTLEDIYQPDSNVWKKYWHSPTFRMIFWSLKSTKRIIPLFWWKNLGYFFEKTSQVLSLMKFIRGWGVGYISLD